jgi:preprotein translocase subunit SecG
MSWFQTLAVVFHVLLAAGIVGLVLLQRGRGADAGAGFGAGASGTVFGARGSASFLSRTTAVLATLFFVSSLLLSYLFSHAPVQTSVMDRVATEQPQPALTAPPANAPKTDTSVPLAPANEAPAPANEAPAPATPTPPQGGSAPEQQPPPGQ